MKKADKTLNNLFLDIYKKPLIKENVLDYPRKTLCPEIWTKEEKLRPFVKKEIMRRFEKWREKIAPSMKVDKWYVLGSITTYQYNNTSDIDINLLVNFNKAQISKIWTSLPNGNELFGHPVNFYLSPDRKDIDQSKSLYDIEADEWERKPSKETSEIPSKYALEIARFFMDGVDLRISEYERDKRDLDKLISLLKDKNSELDKDELEKQIDDKKQEIKADVDSIKLAHYVVKGIRKEGFAGDENWKFEFGIQINQNNDPNKSLNNLIYKQLEQFGYFDKIMKIEKENDQRTS